MADQPHHPGGIHHIVSATEALLERIRKFGGDDASIAARSHERVDSSRDLLDKVRQQRERDALERLARAVDQATGT